MYRSILFFLPLCLIQSCAGLDRPVKPLTLRTERMILDPYKEIRLFELACSNRYSLGEQALLATAINAAYSYQELLIALQQEPLDALVEGWGAFNCKRHLTTLRSDNRFPGHLLVSCASTTCSWDLCIPCFLQELGDATSLACSQCNADYPEEKLIAALYIRHVQHSTSPRSQLETSGPLDEALREKHAEMLGTDEDSIRYLSDSERAFLDFMFLTWRNSKSKLIHALLLQLMYQLNDRMKFWTEIWHLKLIGTINFTFELTAALAQALALQKVSSGLLQNILCTYSTLPRSQRETTNTDEHGLYVAAARIIDHFIERFDCQQNLVTLVGPTQEQPRSRCC